MLEMQLRRQGLQGNKYRLLTGNLKDEQEAFNKAWSRPMELAHRIIPRVIPYDHLMAQAHGKLMTHTELFSWKLFLCLGKISFKWAGTAPRVNIWDPDMLREVMLNKSGHFLMPQVNPLVKLLAQGLSSLEGEAWEQRRKLINPAFHMEKLKGMVPAFQTSCIDLVKRWKKLMSAEGSCELDVWPELQNLTADVISRTAFGSSFEEGKKIFELQKEQGVLVMEAARSLYVPGFSWQEKAREEVLHSCGKNTPDFESISQLKNVNMILHEVLRLYPPVVFLLRHINKKIKLGDITLPSSAEVLIPILQVHHDPEIWGEDAEEFNPERFSEGISKASNGQNAFFPFGWGPRICIGQNFVMIEAKIALAMVLQHFSFALSPSYAHAPYAVITLQPQYGAHLILHQL